MLTFINEVNNNDTTEGGKHSDKKKLKFKLEQLVQMFQWDVVEIKLVVPPRKPVSFLTFHSRDWGADRHLYLSRRAPRTSSHYRKAERGNPWTAGWDRVHQNETNRQSGGKNENVAMGQMQLNKMSQGRLRGKVKSG